MSRQFLPPINRAMKVLDRSFFRKSVPTSAARIFNPRDIARVRKECAPDLLQVKRVELMPPDPLNARSKLLLLRPEVKFDGEWNDRASERWGGAHAGKQTYQRPRPRPRPWCAPT